MISERYPFRLGGYSCIVFIDGREVRPVSSLTSSIGPEVIAQELRAHGFSPTEVVSDYNILFIDTSRRLVLVDTGWGCCTQKMQGRLLRNLHDAGLASEDIDLVILTHGDRDHLGGLVDLDGNASYPNATYVMSQEAWQWYNDPQNLARLPTEFREFYRRTLPVIGEHLQTIVGEEEILPGLSLLPAPGHRPGHSVLRLTLNGKHLLHLADTVGHPIFMLHPDWRWPYDSLPEQAMQTRRQLLGWAAENQALMFGAHLPFPGLGTVIAQSDGWLWEPGEK